ncbi:unnamed protein product, partial [Rotaria sp. Silwood1]
SIAPVTGSQGILFNGARYQLTYSFGYPANIAMGEIMSACIGRTLAPLCTYTGYNGQGLRCGMEGGCSGGPWIVNFNSSIGLGYIISVNSFGCGLYPYTLQGPYFDSTIQSLYDATKTLL